jgi:predicted transcriptional regulator
MLPLVLDSLTEMFAYRCSLVSVIHEPAIGRVIPDLLLGRLLNEPKGLVSRLTYVDATFFALLEEHAELTLEEMKSRVPVSNLAAEKSVGKLERLGIAKTNAEGGVRISDEYRTIEAEVIAIEFKLSRWREALDQAKRYQRFANRTYVVLDAAQVKLDSAIVLSFFDSAVGLILQSHCELRVLLEPIPAAKFTSERVIAVQKLAESLVQDGLPTRPASPLPKCRKPDRLVSDVGVLL